MTKAQRDNIADAMWVLRNEANVHEHTALKYDTTLSQRVAHRQRAEVLRQHAEHLHNFLTTPPRKHRQREGRTT